jgi:hypothetical protein
MEIGHLVDTALHTQIDKFRQVLDEHDVAENIKNSILSNLKDQDDFVSKTFECFKTVKLVESYLRQNFAYVQPTTVKLGTGTFQYISIRETLEKIKADKTFQRLRKPRNICEDNPDGFLLEDVEDGLHFKENKFFLENPDAMR